MNRTAQKIETLTFDSAEEMAEYHKAENADLAERGINTKQAEYWKVSDRQKAEMAALSEGHKKAVEAEAKAAAKADDVDSKPSGKPAKQVGAENRCRKCDAVIPPTGKRGRPAVKCPPCKAEG